MGAIVFASAGGRKYHFDEQCKAFEFGQQLHDWDTPEDAYLSTWAYPKQHRLVRMSATKAAMDGKLPCLACVPPHLRELPSAETFGHEPVSRDVDYWGETVDDPPVCARCIRTVKAFAPIPIGYALDGLPITREQWVDYGVSVAWPCTSALVLGLTPRTARDVA